MILIRCSGSKDWTEQCYLVILSLEDFPRLTWRGRFSTHFDFLHIITSKSVKCLGGPFIPVLRIVGPYSYLRNRCIKIKIKNIFCVSPDSLLFPGAECQSEDPPVVPVRVNAEAGSLVTLSVLFSVADDAVVKWSMDSLTVATWTLGSNVPADVAGAHSDVLRLEMDGSLSLVDVPLNYSQNYTVVFTKSGVADAQAVFELKVYGEKRGITRPNKHVSTFKHLVA